MTIEFRCPNCDRTLRTGDDKAGATAKCPQCGSPVTVPAALVSAPLEEDFGDFTSFGEVREPPAVPPERSGPVEQVACPMCGAANDPATTRCYACGEDLTPITAAVRPEVRSRRFGDVWRAAWETWTANLGLNVAAALISGGMLFATYLVLVALVIVGGFGIAAGGGDRAEFLILAAVGLGYLLFFLVYCYLLVGLSNFALRQIRHREVNLGALFPPIGKFLPSLLCTLLTTLGITLVMSPWIGLYVYGQVLIADDIAIGLLVTIIGYVLALASWGIGWTFFWPVHYLIADRPTAFVAPLADGVRIAASNFTLSFLMALVHTGLLFGGLLSCYIGLLFSMPLSFLLSAVAYDRCLRAARTE